MIAVKVLVDVGIRDIKMQVYLAMREHNHGIKNFKKFDYICNKIMANEGSKNHKSDITFLD